MSPAKGGSIFGCVPALNAAGQDIRLNRAAFALRLGLGFLWVWEGLVPKLLFLTPEGIAHVARTGLVPIDAPTFIRLLGIFEIALGLAILAGYRIRLLAVLQLTLNALFTLTIVFTEPKLLADPLGAMIKNIPMLAAQYAQFCLGAGTIWSWDARRERKKAAALGFSSVL